MEEIWRSLDFTNCPGYEVSNLGRIRNCNKSTKRILKGFLNRKVHPYRQVLLQTFDKKPKAFRVGRLVALAFVPNPDPINKLFVDHIDGDSLNDVASNLRWVTASENMRNPITAARLRKSKKGHAPWNKGLSKKDYSQEYIDNLSKAAAHKKCSDKTKKLISKASKQRWENKEYRAKMTNSFKEAWKIKKESPEYIAKQEKKEQDRLKKKYKIIGIDLSTGNELGRYKSVREASIKTNLSPTYIHNSLNGMTPINKNKYYNLFKLYKFIYDK